MQKHESYDCKCLFTYNSNTVVSGATQLFIQGDTVSKPTELQTCTTHDLNQSLYAIIARHEREEEKEVLQEVQRRLMEYTQINTSMVPPASDELTPHALHLVQCKNAVHFYQRVSQILNNRGLLDWNQQQFEKVSDGLGAAIDAMRARSCQLSALICEIFARGGVKFNYLAITDDEVRKPVEEILKKTGQIH